MEGGRYALEGEVNQKRRTKMYRGVFFKEPTDAHELFKIGAFAIFLNFLFCFLILWTQSNEFSFHFKYENPTIFPVP